MGKPKKDEDDGEKDITPVSPDDESGVEIKDKKKRMS